MLRSYGRDESHGLVEYLLNHSPDWQERDDTREFRDLRLQDHLARWPCTNIFTHVNPCSIKSRTKSGYELCYPDFSKCGALPHVKSACRATLRSRELEGIEQLLDAQLVLLHSGVQGACCSCFWGKGTALFDHLGLILRPQEDSQGPHAGPPPPQIQHLTVYEMFDLLPGYGTRLLQPHHHPSASRAYEGPGRARRMAEHLARAVLTECVMLAVVAKESSEQHGKGGGGDLNMELLAKNANAISQRLLAVLDKPRELDNGRKRWLMGEMGASWAQGPRQVVRRKKLSAADRPFTVPEDDAIKKFISDRYGGATSATALGDDVIPDSVWRQASRIAELSQRSHHSLEERFLESLDSEISDQPWSTSDVKLLERLVQAEFAGLSKALECWWSPTDKRDRMAVRESFLNLQNRWEQVAKSFTRESQRGYATPRGCWRQARRAVAEKNVAG